jgi:hypothetical protein
MKKIISIALILVFVASTIFVVTPLHIPAANASPLDNYIAIYDGKEPLRGTVIEDNPPPPDPVPYYPIGALANFVYANFYTGTYGARAFQLMSIGVNCEIWVATSLAWPAGDPRALPVILPNELAFLTNEFDNLIYPTDVAYFGAPAVRDGNGAGYGPAGYYNGSTRVIVLVMNIRDQNYYQPSYPYYVAGYFSSTVNYYTARNVVTIDSYAWERRLGPLGTIWTDSIAVNRPYVYDSTLAHEFQHLIHADWNPGDDSWSNEGCSMYAEYLCGFGIDPSYLNSFFYTPDNSLTIWGDQGDINILADYGASALFMMYLSDHYGGAATISYFVDNGIPSIDGINVALAHFGYKQTFDDVFHDWRLANLLRQPSGPYSYMSINLNDPSIIPVFTHNVNGFPVPWTAGTSFGNTITDLGYDTGVSKIYGYGTDYITFTNWDRPGFIGFDGDDTAFVPGWTMTADGWYSGTGIDLQNALLAGSVAVSSSNPTLTMVTKWGAESFWDFCFVQVSTDGGNTWTSLANSYTTSDHDPSAHPAIIANLPGLTDYNPDWPSWTTMTFDLTAYAGKTVMIGFRYMTDWATTYEGWWINSATVGGTALTLAPVYPKASYQVTAVKAVAADGKFVYIPYDVSLNPNTWTGEHNTFAKNPTYITLVVSPTMHQGTVDYQFRVYKK